MWPSVWACLHNRPSDSSAMKQGPSPLSHCSLLDMILISLCWSSLPVCLFFLFDSRNHARRQPKKAVKRNMFFCTVSRFAAHKSWWMKKPSIQWTSDFFFYFSYTWFIWGSKFEIWCESIYSCSCLRSLKTDKRKFDASWSEYIYRLQTTPNSEQILTLSFFFLCPLQLT